MRVKNRLVGIYDMKEIGYTSYSSFPVTLGDEVLQFQFTRGYNLLVMPNAQTKYYYILYSAFTIQRVQFVSACFDYCVLFILRHAIAPVAGGQPYI